MKMRVVVVDLAVEIHWWSRDAGRARWRSCLGGARTLMIANLVCEEGEEMMVVERHRHGCAEKGSGCWGLEKWKTFLNEMSELELDKNVAKVGQILKLNALVGLRI